MAYEKTVWKNNEAPKINATNLNKIENGIANAVETDSIARVNNVVSRNLLNLYNFQSQTINGITFTKNEDNSITINGTATQAFGVDFVRFKLKSGTYHLALNETVQNDFYIYDYDTNTGIISNNSTATLTQDYNNVGLDTWINSGTTFNNVTIYPQLEEGTIATPYTPYLNMQELEKNSIINNYSTSEQRIGTWINGKPIYRKIIARDRLQTNNGNIIQIKDINLEEIVKLDGVVSDRNGGNYICYSLNTPVDDTNSYDNSKIFTFYDRGNIVSYVGEWRTLTKKYDIRIILEYTKTTD